jgi:two-component system, OmpR family, phosphate regulon sensor histidine kinase PhoR
LAINTNFTRNFSPNTWTLINSAAIVVVLTILYIISALILHNHIQIFPLLITDTGVFLLSYFFYRYILEKFIYSKIKLIFKTIHTLKSPKGSKNKEIDLRQNIISNVNKEVLLWAEDKKEEIEELRKMESYRREFLGNVSHELKTPLFNIQGYVMTLIDGGLLDATINLEYLQRTKKNIERMIAIIEDLESISRFETGELQLEMKKFDITGLIKEVIELLEINANRKKIKIRLRTEDDKPTYVEGDKDRIRQVLINLIDNSIKYGNEDGRTKICVFDMDENYLVEITDNGIGIDAKDLPRLFERFYRVDKSRSREQGGSGLGLAIVKHIIEAHNQTINVRSTVGVGTTFALTLKKG